jgi:hypothetical protein
MAERFISSSWSIYFFEIFPARTSVKKAFLFFRSEAVIDDKYD